jgi:hypothetical protein
MPGNADVNFNDNGAILVRDTKEHGHGPIHRFTSAEWRAFVAGVHDGEFGLASPAVCRRPGV